jgi:ureidoacrylate peracid hydrolase
VVAVGGDVDQLDFAPASTALLVIDMQNGYCHPESEMARTGPGTERQQAILPAVGELIRLARESRIRVLWSKQVHFEGDVGRLGHRIAPHTAKRRFTPCLSGTWEVDFVSSLASLVDPADYVVTKHRASCFYETSLQAALRMMGVRTLVIAGVNTNFCVESTIRDAYFRDYDIVVIRDCVAGSDVQLHEATLRNTELYFGLVLSLAELHARLSPAAAESARA